MSEAQTVTVPSILSAGVEAAAPGGALIAQPGASPAPFAVSHVADNYWRYPGELLTFFTRVDILSAVPSFTLQISLPAQVTPGEYSAKPALEAVAELAIAEDARHLVWRVERAANAGERFEFTVETTVSPTQMNLNLESVALAIAGEGRARESVEVVVKAKSRYLKYLPALYNDDEVMGRFLMIFESLWNPVEARIENIHYYFDPKMTPSDFLGWLATWSDLAFDDRWTEEQQRKLLASAARLYRIRGTRPGLVEHLEIYTGRRAIITEHRANNFRLGKDSRLGPSIALGRNNRPHSFTVYLRLPVVTLAEDEDESVRRRKEHERRRTIESIIEIEKPAHTTYTLIIENEDK